MILTGNEDALTPIVEAIHQLVDEIAQEEAAHAGDVMRVHEDTLALVLMAMGDALIGAALARSLGLPETAARDRAQRMLENSIASLSQPACAPGGAIRPHPPRPYPRPEHGKP